MLETLFDLWRRADANEDGWIVVRSAVWSRPYGEHVLGPQGDLVLSFEVRDGDEAVGLVDVVCRGVREHKLDDVNGGGISLVDDEDHPAIWQHTEVRRSVVVRAPPNVEVERAIGALWLAHTRATDDWIPFDRYLGREGPIDEVLSSQGTLGEPPETLARVYVEALGELGYEASTLDAIPPVYWDGSEWKPQTAPLRMLHFGDSFVVAERFEAHAAEASA